MTRALRRPLVAFAGAAVVVTVLAVHAAARGEAERRAHRLAEHFTHAVAAPVPLDELQRAGPGRDRLDAAVGELRARGSATHVTLWTTAGPGAVQVAYSDRAGVAGARVAAAPALTRALAGEGPVLEQASPGGGSGADEADGADARVYVAYRDAAARNAVAEVHVDLGADAIERGMLVRVLPLAVAGPVLLATATLPPVVLLARASRRAEARRRELAGAVLAASDTERRHLARLLHDGPIQDLTVLGMTLERASGAAPGTGPAGASAVAGAVRAQVGALRGLLDGLDPVEDDEDVRSHLRAAAQALPGHGVRVDVAGSALEGASPAVRSLVRRVGAELVRNAVRHASARTVTVDVAQRAGGEIRLTVRDDGVGFVPGPPRPGHRGLALARYAVEAAGGVIELVTGGAGTTVRVTLPAAAAPPVLGGRDTRGANLG